MCFWLTRVSACNSSIHKARISCIVFLFVLTNIKLYRFLRFSSLITFCLVFDQGNLLSCANLRFEFRDIIVFGNQRNPITQLFAPQVTAGVVKDNSIWKWRRKEIQRLVKTWTYNWLIPSLIKYNTTNNEVILNW